MALRLTAALAATLVLSVLAAVPAGASSVAYIDNNNVVLSSPDGSKKFSLTTNGTADARWSSPSQGPDGKTVAVLGASGSSSKVLYLFDAKGKQVTANVMPVYSGATIPVYPIGLDMDWNSQAVAYGYSYCTFACNSVVQGTGSRSRTTRVCTRATRRASPTRTFRPSSGSGSSRRTPAGACSSSPTCPRRRSPARTRAGSAATACPFHARPSRPDRSPGRDRVEGQELRCVRDPRRPASGHPAQHRRLAVRPAGGGRVGNVSFSPDGQFVAWGDAEGVKVAGAPNLAAGTEACTLTSPVPVCCRRPAIRRTSAARTSPGSSARAPASATVMATEPAPGAR